MISTDLLARLQEADPEIFSKFRYTEIATYIEYDDFGNTENYIYQEDLIEPAQEAWLQHCLQDAIQARGWYLAIDWTGAYTIDHLRDYGCYQAATGPENDLSLGDGDTEAEALCLAYLEAIEAVK